jgi:type VI secretion system secreted protein Hcp
MNCTKLVLFIAALACLPIPAHSQVAAQAAPPRAYVKIVGKVQGTFKGEASRIAGNNYIAALRFSYQITSPRDPATGLPTGKRQQMPITFTKAFDATSPQIYQALISNELLTQVTIEFMNTSTAAGVGAAAAAKEVAYYTITLTNATVSDIHQHMDQAEATAAGGSTVPLDPMEDVTITFDQIQVSSAVGQTTATDSWSTADK